MNNKKPEKSYYLTSMITLERAVRAISKLTPTKEKCYKVKITLDTETRSIKQNKLQFLWLNLRSEFCGNSPAEERRYCKMAFGIPILLVEDEDFSNFYMKALNHLTYEEILQVMEFVPVTSRMNTKQFAKYLTEIDTDAAKQGLLLPRPIDLYEIAIGRKSASQRRATQ